MGIDKRFKIALRSLISFSEREKRRVLLLLPLLIALALVFVWQSSPRIEQSFTRVGDLLIDTGYPVTKWPKSDNSKKEHINESSYTLFSFDPNTTDLNGFMQLGFTRRQAETIINYRNSGAQFRKPEDFAKCYSVSEPKFKELLPYILISNEIPTKDSVKSIGTRVDIKTRNGDNKSTIRDGNKENNMSSPSSDHGASTQTSRANQTEYQSGKSTKSTYTSADNKQAFYPQATGSTPSKPVLTELNSADSAQLVAIRGIGATTALRIINYRNLLGGFASIEQLQEILGMTEQNYLLILQQISVDNSGITKIDINFASPEEIKGHPYLPANLLNKILKQRQLKGGWSNTRDLTEQNILSEEQATRLAPYLIFRTK